MSYPRFLCVLLCHYQTFTPDPNNLTFSIEIAVNTTIICYSPMKEQCKSKVINICSDNIFTDMLEVVAMQ